MQRRGRNEGKETGPDGRGLWGRGFLDNGNRTSFMEGGAFRELHPDFQPKHWADTCVPLVLDGPEIVAAKEALLARATKFGFAVTPELDIHILADGIRIDPLPLGNGRVGFCLPEGAQEIVLASRSFIPAHVGPESQDARTLGINVSSLQLDGTDITLDDDSYFTVGWNEVESLQNGVPLRWTKGNASVPSCTSCCRRFLRRPLPAGRGTR